MGAKQSKRSVDISGKEAESAGEVAASIAAGEGRLEPLADADALKPQLNGDAHNIHDTEEKQKEIDSGTPENEKDATTEKENQKPEDDKEVTPVTNGESEQKVENGETTPTPEDGKKPKKEKVKKKWSLRSISFSRKDKPKQEKKAKDEEPKVNGEPEKVPEETADVASEVPVVTEAAEEAKTPSEAKEDKTPETPVTEPMTNGSSTPESPKAETPVAEEPAAPSPVVERPESKTEVEPEKLPVNGLSIDESPKETPEPVKSEDNKEEPIVETAETVPEISVKKEVCVEQMPLIDSTPPPLPANPPPSSVASFAATTMAPEMSDASLANTADNATLPPPSPPSDTLKDKVDDIASKHEANVALAQNVRNELSSPVDKEVTSHPITENGMEYDTKENITLTTVPVVYLTVDNVKAEPVIIESLLVDKAKVLPQPETLSFKPEIIESEISSCKLYDAVEVPTTLVPEMPAPPPESNEESVVEKEHTKEIVLEQTEPEVPSVPPLTIDVPKDEKVDDVEVDIVPAETETDIEKKLESTESELLPSPPPSLEIPADVEEHTSSDDLPEPPPPLDDDAPSVHSSAPHSEHAPDTAEGFGDSDNLHDTEPHNELAHDKNEDEKTTKKSTDSLPTENTIETIECNGNGETESAEVTSQESIPVVNGTDSAVEAERAEQPRAESGDTPLAPPADHSQEALPISDKLAEFITEVPEVPELKTATETTSGEGEVSN